jgi:hydrogenase expression/formation protein HypD
MNSTIQSIRNKKVVQKLVDKIQQYDGPNIKIMEVCGTHTMAISKYGIRNVLPKNIALYSGPGCPVCVTPSYYMNAVLAIADLEDIIITTFGDMMRIPYQEENLLGKKALGKDIRIVYSPLDSLKIAKENPRKKVVFLSVGFETTIPVIASAVLEAESNDIENFYLLSANKTIHTPMKILSSDEEIGIDGYIYPGHVSSIIGDQLYQEIAKEYNIPGVITGFEALDILSAIQILIQNIQEKNFVVDNLYSRVVKRDGNQKALGIMHEVFESENATWRGIGEIPDSGMKLRKKYQHRDGWQFIQKEFLHTVEENPACKCGEILKGKCLPKDCDLFGKVCLPENPMGSCMVSSEGTCAAYYRYDQ